MQYRLDHRAAGRFARRVYAVIIGLTVLHVVTRTIVRIRGVDDISTFELVDMQAELSLPTYASVALAAACAAVAVLLAVTDGRRQWWGFAGIFAYVSIDDAVMVHERVSNFMERRLDGTIWVRSWVLVGGAAVALFVVALVPFVKRLERPVRRTMLYGAALFVAGSLVLEWLGGRICASAECTSYPWIAQVALEETFEMWGLTLFLLAFIRVAQDRRVVIAFGDQRLPNQPVDYSTLTPF